MAKWALWSLESIDKDFFESKDFKKKFYVKPLIAFFNDPIEERNQRWCYHAAICALKEAEKLMQFLHDSFMQYPQLSIS